jgi:hypothetical protein
MSIFLYPREFAMIIVEAPTPNQQSIGYRNFNEAGTRF